MHIYIIDGFKKMFLLLNLEKVFNEGFENNLITLILRFLVEYGGLPTKKIANKVVCSYLDGIAVFINPHTNVVI